MKHQDDQVSDSNESSTERNNNNENQGMYEFTLILTLIFILLFKSDLSRVWFNIRINRTFLFFSYNC